MMMMMMSEPRGPNAGGHVLEQVHRRVGDSQPPRWWTPRRSSEAGATPTRDDGQPGVGQPCSVVTRHEVEVLPEAVVVSPAYWVTAPRVLYACPHKLLTPVLALDQYLSKNNNKHICKAPRGRHFRYCYQKYTDTYSILRVVLIRRVNTDIPAYATITKYTIRVMSCVL